jgi:hypothetical protein
MQRGEHDLADLVVKSHWQVTPEPKAAVSARLSSGAPLLLENTVGRGHVVLQTLALNRSDSNLIALVSFPVVMHLVLQRLAAGDIANLNHQPSAHLIVSLHSPGRNPAAEAGGDTATLIAPDGTQRRVSVAMADGWPVAEVGTAAAPGVYRVQWGESLIPFTVKRDGSESDLAAATPAILKEVGGRLGITWIDDLSELTAAARGESNRQELWKALVATTLVLLAVETLLTRWVVQRRSASASAEVKP